jgi:hypothetical protein
VSGWRGGSFCWAWLAWLHTLSTVWPLCRASTAVLTSAETLLTLSNRLSPAAPAPTTARRLIDGREAVTFLKRIKEIVEDPRRLLLDV